MEEIAPNVGPRIRAMREQRRLSLRALAERCNLSINAISLIERGENSPTVSSLHMLATALGVKITDFFEDAHEHAVVYVRRDQRLATQGNGLLMESLGIGLRNQQLQPFMVTIEPGVGDAGESIAHPGQEFVHCSEGTVLYQVSGQMYHLEPGDSLLFEATQPHCFRNAGDFASQSVVDFPGARRQFLSATAPPGAMNSRLAYNQNESSLIGSSAIPSKIRDNSCVILSYHTQRSRVEKTIQGGKVLIA